MKLFFDEKNKTYILFAEDTMCTNCKEILDNVAFLHRNKNDVEYSPFCHDCISIAEKLSSIIGIYETINAIITDVIPDKATPLFPTRMSTTGVRGSSVFDGAVDDSSFSGDTSSYEIVDNTKLACKESLQGARIGADIPNDELVYDVKKELEMWSEADPVIEFKEKPRLQGGKTK